MSEPSGSVLRNPCTIVLMLAFFSAALAGESSPNSNAPLPAGPMQEKATAACSTCHEARIIVQQRLSKPAWTKEMDNFLEQLLTQFQNHYFAQVHRYYADLPKPDRYADQMPLPLEDPPF